MCALRATLQNSNPGGYMCLLGRASAYKTPPNISLLCSITPNRAIFQNQTVNALMCWLSRDQNFIRFRYVRIPPYMTLAQQNDSKYYVCCL
jgi:hypothetical protein